MKPYLIALISLVFACEPSYGGPACIFQGNQILCLKPNISLQGGAKVLSLSVDPTVTPVEAPPGSIGMRDNGTLYVKLDSGSSTNWELSQTGLTDLTTDVTGILPIANGGTNASNASDARANIGANDASNLDTGTIPDGRIQSSGVTQHQGDLFLGASQINTGTFADARIAETNVTQHEAALSLSASQVTTGTFADARISESSITQHQAAIDHDQLLNYVANEHIDWTSATENLSTTGTVQGASVNASGTGANQLPNGTTGERPANAAGLLRYNNSDLTVEFNDGTQWIQLGASATAGMTSSFVTADVNPGVDRIFYVVDTSGGDVTITLPASASGLRIGFLKTTDDVNQVIIDPDGTEIIDDQAGGETLTLSDQYAWAVLWGDGTGWKGQYPGVSVAANQQQTEIGFTDTDPTPWAHGLGSRPTDWDLLIENQVNGTGEVTSRKDLCDPDATNLNCDTSSLTIDGTHRIKLIAAVGRIGSDIPETGATTQGTVALNQAYTWTAQQTYTLGPIVSNASGPDITFDRPGFTSLGVNVGNIIMQSDGTTRARIGWEISSGGGGDDGDLVFYTQGNGLGEFERMRIRGVDGKASFSGGISLGTNILTSNGNQTTPINIGSFQNVTSMSITAGRWIIWGYQEFSGTSGPNAGTKNVAISSFSGNTQTDHTIGINQWRFNVTSSGNFDPQISGTYIVDVPATTTYYLKIQDNVGTSHIGRWAMRATQIQ